MISDSSTPSSTAGDKEQESADVSSGKDSPESQPDINDDVMEYYDDVTITDQQQEFYENVTTAGHTDWINLLHILIHRSMEAEKCTFFLHFLIPTAKGGGKMSEKASACRRRSPPAGELSEKASACRRAVGEDPSQPVGSSSFKILIMVSLQKGFRQEERIGCTTYLRTKRWYLNLSSCHIPL